ncbi:MAG TPA: hypothetical protein DGN59_09400 [Candidatus Latescibacteria bacterium]|nr:hypothetical protein [Candidatus Latescibacterota bacterium]
MIHWVGSCVLGGLKIDVWAFRYKESAPPATFCQDNQAEFAGPPALRPSASLMELPIHAYLTILEDFLLRRSIARC